MGNHGWQLRNGCDNSSMAKFLITIIQVNLVPSPSENEGYTNSYELLLLKFLPTVTVISWPPSLTLHLFSPWLLGLHMQLDASV